VTNKSKNWTKISNGNDGRRRNTKREKSFTPRGRAARVGDRFTTHGVSHDRLVTS
jgi:hypothetical protein